jgi:hypothetical protein
LRRTLREHLPATVDAPIYQVSARQGLQAKQEGDAEGVRRSGLAQVERHLVRFLAHEKVRSLQRAVAVKAGAVLDAAGTDIALGIRALEMPIEELEQRAAEFIEALRDIERQRLVARDLLAGDRRRAIEELAAQAAALRREARTFPLAALEPTFDAGRPDREARSVVAGAIPEFFEAKLAESSRALSSAVEEILAGHVRSAEALIGAVREAAAALFEIPSIPFDVSETFIVAREPYWVTQKWSEMLNPLAGGALDRLLPAAARATRMKRRLAAEIDELVQRNVENLRWATLQNLDSTFYRFVGWFDDRLAETIEATRGAIDAALVQRRNHTDRARDELARLHQGAEILTVVQKELARDIRAAEAAEEGAREPH